MLSSSRTPRSEAVLTFPKYRSEKIAGSAAYISKDMTPITVKYGPISSKGMRTNVAPPTTTANIAAQIMARRLLLGKDIWEACRISPPPLIRPVTEIDHEDLPV